MKRLILGFVSSTILLFALVPIGGYGGHHIKFSISLVSYGVLTYLFLKYQPKKTKPLIMLAILFPIVLVFLPFYVIDFERTRSTLPSSLAQILGILIGYYSFTLTLKRRLILIAVSLCFCFFTTFKGYELWLNKINYGSFSGMVRESVGPFTLFTKENKMVSNNDFKGKVVVLDFWISSCAPCFRKFPLVEKKYLQYRKNPDVLIYSVNIPLKNEAIDLPERLFTSLNYQFESLYARNGDLAKQFGVSSYPTVIILNKKQQIIFRGDISSTDEILRMLTKSL